jgi:lipopolysaccharide biosynthesis protein
MKRHMSLKPPLIAFHLPQYHPIPENDRWWGRGFTEWTNVTRCAPRFKGHYQPHLPADLGYYDLRLPEVRAAQADLARQYGIHGFCYYHYWFQGRRLLERPVNDILKSGEPDFPFCLCWANEPWTRNWDGSNREVLVEQRYSPEDDVAHARSLLPAFMDPRYIRLDGKPLFLIYRALHLPDIERTVQRWRDVAMNSGIGELFLARVESNFKAELTKTSLGFDAVVEFAPDLMHVHKKWNAPRLRSATRALMDSVSYRGGLAAKWCLDRVEEQFIKLSSYSNAVYNNKIIEYMDVVKLMVSKSESIIPRFRCVFPGWDNSARRKNDAIIVVGSTPDLYEEWLRGVVLTEVKKSQNRPIFVNAWNEWAEGCHLEPCVKWGRSYLEATKRALQQVARTERPGAPCVSNIVEV